MATIAHTTPNLSYKLVKWALRLAKHCQLLARLAHMRCQQTRNFFAPPIQIRRSREWRVRRQAPIFYAFQRLNCKIDNGAGGSRAT